MKVLSDDEVKNYISTVQEQNAADIYGKMEAVKNLIMHAADNTIAGQVASIIASQIPLRSLLLGTVGHETYEQAKQRLDYESQIQSDQQRLA
jgi:hypothetical protein